VSLFKTRSNVNKSVHKDANKLYCLLEFKICYNVSGENIKETIYYHARYTCKCVTGTKKACGVGAHSQGCHIYMNIFLRLFQKCSTRTIDRFFRPNPELSSRSKLAPTSAKIFLLFLIKVRRHWHKFDARMAQHLSVARTYPPGVKGWSEFSESDAWWFRLYLLGSASPTETTHKKKTHRRALDFPSMLPGTDSVILICGKNAARSKLVNSQVSKEYWG
jgi:hypothetical protein